MAARLFTARLFSWTAGPATPYGHAIQAAGTRLRVDVWVKGLLTREHMFYMMPRRSRQRTFETEAASAIALGIHAI